MEGLKWKTYNTENVKQKLVCHTYSLFHCLDVKEWRNWTTSGVHVWCNNYLVNMTPQEETNIYDVFSTDACLGGMSTDVKCEKLINLTYTTGCQD